MHPLLLAGVPPTGLAGNAVSTEVLLDALAPLADVTLLSHRTSPLPTWKWSANGLRQVSLGTQPFSVHGEALLAGGLYRGRLRDWLGAWVVNSRYASALYAAGVPYIIWEATTIRDELQASSFQDIRKAGRGTGLGRALHSAVMPLGSRLEAMLYRHAVAVLAMSPYTRNRILEQHDLPHTDVMVLPHPPAPAFLSVLRLRRAESKAVPRRQPGPWKLLFVGRADDPRKNFVMLLEAARLLRMKGRTIELTVIGPHNARWRSSLDLQGIGDVIQFHGAVATSQLVDAYLSHDVLLVPSRQEGFGIVVAEAFAAGLPVVATTCGGPEQIIQDSKAGLLVEHTAAALARGTEDLLEMPARHETMRERALKYAENELGFGRFAAAVADATDRFLHVRAT